MPLHNERNAPAAGEPEQRVSVPQQLVDGGLGSRLRVHRLDDHGAVEGRPRLVVGERLARQRARHHHRVGRHLADVDLAARTVDNVFSVLQGVDAGANLIVLTGAGVFFLTRIEERLKRRAALKALHELRSIVHVIDMHQLTKDPSAVVSVAGNTPSSPARTLSRFEVTRYLDYCSEMLSLTSKVAVLFAQGFPDPIVTETVSDIERIAAGLAQKIWQKIIILEALGPEKEGSRQ